MSRKMILGIEELEGRAMLSGITYSITTDQPVYQVGQTIQITFTETNAGDQAATVELSPTDFSVAQGDRALWQSDPGNAGQPSTSVTLQPGQSVSQTASWDGTIPYPFDTGESGQAPSLNQWGSFTVTNPNAPTGDSATFQITDPITVTLTTDQQVYQMGQPVQVTYTESNTSGKDVTFLPGAPTALTFWHDGSNVTPVAYPQSINLNSSTLPAGKTITWSQTWNAIPESGPYNPANLTGTFVASYGPEDHPQEYTASFQITPPPAWDIVSSIATDQSVYQAGQAVNVTFDETNAGDQPVMVVVGHQSFTVMQDGQFAWSPLGASLSPDDGWEMLSPGQTITQTVAWDGTRSNRQPATGTFVVTNTVDPNRTTASFQIDGAAMPVSPDPIPVDPINDPPPGDVPTPVSDPTNPVPVTQVTAPSTGDVATLVSKPTVPVPVGTTTQYPGTVPQTPADPGVTSVASLDRRAYKVGQSIHLKLQFESEGSSRSSLPRTRGRELISVTNGSTLVYEASRTVRASRMKGIPLGRALELNVSWDGRSNQPGIHTPQPGTYTIHVTYDGLYDSVATIQLESRSS